MLSRRILAAVAVLCAIGAPAQAQKTKAQLSTEIGANFPDNNTGLITPQNLRTVTGDIVNSIMPNAPVIGGNFACFNGTTGLLQDCGVAPSLTIIQAGSAAYGITWDGATDDTVGWANLQAAINATGGGVIVLMPSGKTSMIWSDASGAPSASLLSITVPNVTMFWNGSGLTTDQAHFNSANLNALFFLSNVSGFESHDFRYTQTGTTGLQSVSTTGGAAFYLNGSTSNVRLYGTVLNNARSFVEIASPVWQTQSPRAQQITIINASLNSVYYGINGQGNGDLLFARGVNCNNVGRCVFPWNVSKWDVDVTSNAGGPFNDVLIKTYADPAASTQGNTTSDIKVGYRNIGRQNVTASQSLVALEFQQNTGTPTPGAMRNITLDLDVDRTVNGQPVGVTTYKFNSAGTIDNTPRGYVMENVRIGGAFNNYNDGNAAIDLFNTTNGSFSGETCRNIILRDLIVQGSSTSTTVNGNCTTNNLVLENIVSNQASNITNVGGSGVLSMRNVFTTNNFQDQFNTQFNLVKNTVAATPASGLNVCGADSTNNVFYCKNDAGNKAILVTPNAGTANQFLTGMSAAGVLNSAQPAASNLSNGTTGSGAVVLAATPTFTAGITTSAASNFNVPTSNLNAFNFNVVAAASQVGMSWSQTGAAQWSLYKETDNSLRFYDQLNGTTVATVGQGTGTTATFKLIPTTPATSTTTGALQSAGGLGVAGAGWFGTYVNVTPTVVNSLPACNSGLDGARAFVTNNATATAFGGAVTTGGANHHPVYCDGSATAWKQG